MLKPLISILCSKNYFLKNLNKQAQCKPLLLLGVLMCLGFSNGVQAEAVTGAAKDFTLKTNTGVNLRLAEEKGKVVLLNFWASWCAPCREELPLLDDMHKKYEKLGFTVLGVNIDEKPSAAMRVLEDIPVQFPVLMDPKNQVAQLYDIEAMPTTYIIDRAGQLRFLHRGFQKGYEVKYEKEVKQLLRE